MIPEVIANQNFIQVTNQDEGIFFADDRFQIIVDCKDFNAENIRCTVTDQCVEICAEALEKSPSRLSGIALCRRYQLPKRTNPRETQCFLLSGGVLFITGPWI